jgi:ubiquinone/menaquinone biosynthesis C-methylase UbiE
MPVALRRQKMVKEYYTDDTLSVRFYDAITSVDPHIRGDVDFYAAYLRSPGERVLELGCGTGRVAIALAAGDRVRAACRGRRSSCVVRRASESLVVQ